MKFQSNLTAAAISVAMVGLAAPTSAAIISADFSASFDLPDAGQNGPRVFQNLDVALGAGNELDDSHEILNPSRFSGSAFVDLSSTGLITLTGSHQPDGFADYDIASITISNIVFDAGETISGVGELVSDLLDPGFGLGQVSPLITFGADSINILFDTSGSGEVSDFELADGGVSTFQLDLGVSEVPLPAGLPLMLLGMGAMGALRSRRKSNG